VRPVTTREQLRNSTVLANNLLTLQIRYLKDINNTYKVIYQGYEYDIVNITADWKADSIILTVIMNDDTSRIRNT
jgi:SPP1 family predicted phage head-tail adaptor